ncbi:hypothetical protein [Sulfitobacter dubius]|uniref:hypothetical protein n=1 Tax=Sulfitobacter dubius TaxID=218673 RepID=UPI0030DD367A
MRVARRERYLDSITQNVRHFSLCRDKRAPRETGSWYLHLFAKPPAHYILAGYSLDKRRKS